MIERQAALDLVLACLRAAVELDGGDPAAVGPETTIVGQGAIITSIGVVTLIVDIEQRLEAEHELALTLASDRAMSQRSSPFRDARTLADHILATALEGQTP